MSIALIVPDAQSLINFFFLHRPCKPIDGWVKPARRYGLRAETISVVVVLLLAVVPSVIGLSHTYARQLASQRHPPPITGEWHLVTATQPFLTGDGVPLVDVFFEPTGRVMLRSSDGVLWRAGAHLDDKKHTLQLFHEGADGPPPVYAMTQSDPTRLLLTPIGEDVKKNGTLTLVRVPLPTHYPLEDRGFHWVNEWGLER
jgi:hypothetical protein